MPDPTGSDVRTSPAAASPTPSAGWAATPSVAGSLGRIAAVRARAAGAARASTLRDVLLVFVVTRTLLTAVGLLGIAVLPRRPFRIMWDASPDNPIVNMWARWDGYWYVNVAQNGYSYVPGFESSVAFWPLFPTLTRLLGALMGRTDTEGLAIAGIIVSNVALVLAVVLLVMLVRRDFDEDTAARTAVYLLVFPTTFFLSAVYADSLFLLFSVASFYCARTNRWWLAGLLGGAGALTRPHGALMLIPLAVEYLHQRGWSLRRIRLDLLGLALVPLGLLLHLAYIGSQFGTPFAALETQRAWGRTLAVPWQAIQNAFGVRTYEGVLDLTFTAILLVLVVASWRLLRPSYALFGTIVLLGALTSGTLMSISRLGVTVFPIFMVLAVWGRRPQFDRLYVIGAAGAAAIFMALFAQWYWVA